MSYEDGFRDAIDLVEHYLRKYNISEEKIRKIIRDLREAITEEKMEKVKMKLGLI
ncbi:MAG: hypothetical protein J7K23_04155 [Thermoproteales archaeon]|nr:hypothetical protein [Thermoproteales archaeon]